MNLVFISHVPHDISDNRFFVAAAARAGARAAYIEWRQNRTIFIGEKPAAMLDAKSTPDQVAQKVYELIGREKTIIVDGMGTKLNTASLLFPKPMADSLRVYAVFDDFRYDATGLRLLKFHLMDQFQRRHNDYVWVYNHDILERYPGAICVDNATHITPLPANPNADPSRILYIGSIDQRTDTQLLADIAAQNPDMHIDIFGTVQNVEEHLKALIQSRRNIHFFGKFREDEFPGILSRYRVGLIPYKADHNMTRYISSSKMFHYLNAGLEVIATPFPHARYHADFIHLIRSAEDWRMAYQDALARPLAPAWPYEKFLWDARWRELRTALAARGD